MIPVLFPPIEKEPSTIIFMANHLGESLENDQRSRAHTVAEELGALVIAYERTGTGSRSKRIYNMDVDNRFQPDNYSATAAQTGRVLESAVPESLSALPRVFYGSSAGGVDAAAVTLSETLRVDFLAVASPAAMQRMGRLEYGLRWLREQFSENNLPASEPSTAVSAEPALSTKDMILRAIPEIVKYEQLWRSELAFSDLREIGHKAEFGHIAVNIAILRQSFTPSPRKALQVSRVLDVAGSHHRPSAFRANLVDRPHSFYNDPINRASFIAETLALEKKSSA